MTKDTQNGIYKGIIAVLISVAMVITASWAVEDRMESKIRSVRSEYASESQCIRKMEVTLGRIEERLKNIEHSLDDKK